jgi:acyl-coenzyme A synthetase/AMP-(fatty) acid ligase
MKMPRAEFPSLHQHLAVGGAASGVMLQSARASVVLAGMARAPSGRASALARKSVLVLTRDQLTSAVALLDLDGIVRRLVLCPPDFTKERLASAIEQAEVEAIVGDDLVQELGINTLAPFHDWRAPAGESNGESISYGATEWILPTSGTTGAPKLVVHSLAGLAGSIEPTERRAKPLVWATFYDIRRYGGLQIFLRALIGGHTLLIAEQDEPFADHLIRCGAAGVTHISGTPSHWRRVLMSLNIDSISPEYVRLSGEIADQVTLDGLRSAYPDARIVHAYASTEAGVAFEVTDGREGFPTSFVGKVGGIETRVAEGSLHIRSSRTAQRYLGRDDIRLTDDEGFVDTDDSVGLRGDRYYFLGRGAGVINVGGLKVHPEEVEQVINLHDGVRMSLVKARRNPFTGSIIVADIVLKGVADEADSSERRAAVRDEIFALCRAHLERHKVPVSISFVPSVEMSANGKLVRRLA